VNALPGICQAKNRSSLNKLFIFNGIKTYELGRGLNRNSLK
jgi:hypothetical protein